MIKLISLFTIISFIITNVCGTVFANTFTIPKSFQNNINIQQQILTDEDAFSKYGQIMYSSYKKNSPLVVLINDLHNNSVTQKNIEQIISFFNEKSN